jgi:hypothetical protein
LYADPRGYIKKKFTIKKAKNEKVKSQENDSHDQWSIFEEMEKTTKSLRVEAKLDENMQKQGAEHCYNYVQRIGYKEFSKKK